MPQSTEGNSTVPDKTDTISELLEERRYTITKMYHAVTIYFAILGFAVREMIAAHQCGNEKLVLLFAVGLTLAQAGAVYAVMVFRKIVSILNTEICSRPGSPYEGYRKFTIRGIFLIYPFLVIAQIFIFGIAFS